MDVANRALLSTEIALAAGFSDHSHLAKTFKRHTGLTPSEFRKQFGLR